MTTTKVSICNQALNLIGAQSIISFDESTQNARRCATLYDQTRKAILRMHPWSCCIKRTQLAPLAKKPSFGYSNAFPLPSDFERVISASVENYEIENRHILANTDLINLIYVYDNDNEETWDSLLVECMTYFMASKLAKATTGSNSEADSAWQRLQVTLKQARAINGQERPSQDFSFNHQSELIGARY